MSHHVVDLCRSDLVRSSTGRKGPLHRVRLRCETLPPDAMGAGSVERADEFGFEGCLDLVMFLLELIRQILSFRTDTDRGSNGTEVGDDGEGTPSPTATKLLVIASEEGPDVAMDLERGKSLTGGGVGGGGLENMGGGGGGGGVGGGGGPDVAMDLERGKSLTGGESTTK
ncbi:hypothetical protein QYE76_067227 [Lolium multiflorum]|uniref:Uncharacterized protein n=1 Tax=Lolium multiflorum TaxID=4521 RepID=A0AAD8SE50_LOLMU|nr:hypothetical protein QYE76_067227 [Lolium multiflorum]